MDYADLVDWLDRRHEYIAGFAGQTFLLELHRFLEDLLHEPALSSIVGGFLDAFRMTGAVVEEQSVTDRHRLHDFLQRLIGVAPTLQGELDEPDIDPDGDRAAALQSWTMRQATLRFVVDAALGTARLALRESTGPRDFLNLPEDRAYEMLLNRIQGLEEATRATDDCQRLLNDVIFAKQTREHMLTQVRLREPTQAYSALKWLVDASAALNPEPIRVDSIQERVRIMMSRHPGDATWAMGIRKVAFEGAPFPSDVEADLRQALTRLYHHLRLGINQHRTWDALIRRYKQRSEWYDRGRLRALSAQTERAEDALSDDLALFIFDHGLPVLVRHSFGGHIPDHAGPEDAGLLIEAKAYHKAYRGELVSGLGQLVSYMQTLAGTKFAARVAYYVVFRLDGPLYLFDEEIRVGAVVIHPIVVDVGSGGGRARRKVDPISADEVLSKMASTVS